jgi:GNAT superfamily N-acetyltransferase
MRDEPLALVIRPFADADLPAVRALFVQVNRDLAPPAMREAFEAYIARSLSEEIDRIPAYYGEREGGFWVSHDQDGALLGTFGIERAADDGAEELRRMYVQPSARRRGVARAMLAHAEAEARRAG